MREPILDVLEVFGVLLRVLQRPVLHQGRKAKNSDLFGQ